MRALALFAIGLIFGGGLGSVTAAGLGVVVDGHDHADPVQHSTGMDHTGMADHGITHDTPLDVETANVPSLEIELIRDPMAGYDQHVLIEDLTVAPEQTSREHAQVQGHARFDVNGEKQGRLYGPWVYPAALPKGEITVEVVLSLNSHQPLAADDAPVKASTTLEIK